MKVTHLTHGPQHISEDSSSLGTRGAETQDKLWHRWGVFLMICLESQGFKMHQVQNNLQWRRQQNVFGNALLYILTCYFFICQSNLQDRTVLEGGTWRCLCTGMLLKLSIYCLKSKGWRQEHPEGNESGFNILFMSTLLIQLSTPTKLLDSWLTKTKINAAEPHRMPFRFCVFFSLVKDWCLHYP